MASALQWLSAALLIAGMSWGLFFAPTEQNMGEIYRALYVHVPSALTAFLVSFVLLGVSIWGLIKKSPASAYYGKALAEAGFIYTCLALATGSIWGRATWGVWWTWDARLTTTLILGIQYAGFLALYDAYEDINKRITACAVMGILIAINVPIVYKSVTWWRTLHQPPSLMRPGGSTMSPEIMTPLFFCLFAFIFAALVNCYQRYRSLALENTLDDYREEHLAA